MRDILGVNRFSVLNDKASSSVDLTTEDLNDDQSVQQPIKTHESNSRTASIKQKPNKDNTCKLANFKKKKTVDSTKDRPRSTKSGKKETVIIAEDSTVKNVIGAKMSSDDPDHFYVVKSFPGATLADMKDFLRPLTRRKPDKLTLHVGTNDLKHSQPRVIAESIVDLVFNVNEKSPETNVGISTLLVRNDNNNLSVKVNQVNNILKAICNQNGIPFLANTNITVTHLNSRGLHLNRQGSAILQRNFKKFVNNLSN